MSTTHLIALGVWLVLLAAAATAWAITRDRRAAWAVALLLAPLAGVAWVWGLLRRRGAGEETPGDTGLEEATDPRPPPPITYPEEMTHARPLDHPDVSDAERERARRRARIAAQLDDASRDHLDELDRELEALLED